MGERRVTYPSPVHTKEAQIARESYSTASLMVNNKGET